MTNTQVARGRKVVAMSDRRESGLRSVKLASALSSEPHVAKSERQASATAQAQAGTLMYRLVTEYAKTGAAAPLRDDRDAAAVAKTPRANLKSITANKASAKKGVASVAVCNAGSEIFIASH